MADGRRAHCETAPNRQPASVGGVKRAAILVSLLACNAAPPAKPVYADADALPKELAPESASAPPSAAPPTASSVAVVAPIGRARAPIATAAQAVAEFQAAWKEEVLPATSGRQSPDVSQFSEVVAETKRLSARRVECRAGHRRVDNTLGGKERTDLVFFSSIPALNRDGDCWEVAASTGRFNEILGYFDPATGALLMVWLVPEG